MATTQKAIELAHELADKLKKRISLAVAESFDSNGHPLIQVGEGTDNAEGAVVRIKPIDWALAKDILGLASQVYTPHVIQICVESSDNGNGDSVEALGYNTWANLLPLLGQCLETGCKVEVYAVANDTGVTNIMADIAASFGSSNLKASYDNLYYPMVNSQ